MKRHSTLFRAVASLSVGGAVGLLAAWAMGLAGVYLSGHGAGLLGGPVLFTLAVDTHVTLADAVVLIAALLAGGITWTELGGHA